VRLFIYLILFLKLQLAHGQNCAGLSEGQEFRLDAPGQPMQNLRVQDQDGMGTCFANAASQMLMSANPQFKEAPSYHQLALGYLQRKHVDSKIDNGKYSGLNEVDSSAPDKGPQSVMLRGGGACGAIEAAKDEQKTNGGLCPQSKTGIEKLISATGNGEARDLMGHQEKLVAAMTNHMDRIQKTLNGNRGVHSGKAKPLPPAMMAGVREASKNLQNWAFDEAHNVCSNKSKMRDFPETKQYFVKLASRYYEANPECFQNSKSTAIKDPELCEFVRSLTSAKEISSSTSGIFPVTLGMSNYMSGSLERTLYPSKEPIKYELINRKVTPVYAPQVSLKNSAEFKQAVDNAIVNAIAPTPGSDPKGALARLKKYQKAGEDSAYTADFDLHQGKISQSCIQREAFEILSSSDRIKAWTAITACEYSEILVGSSEIYKAMSSSGISDLNKALDLIAGSAASGPAKDGVLAALGANCDPSEKVKIPENLTCQYRRISPPSLASSPGKPEFEEARMKYRNVVLQNLRTGKLPVTSICTRFFGESNFSYAQVPEGQRDAECQKAGKHGFHAMATGGYRCKGGKLEYMMINSWGAHWKPPEHLQGENGRVWISEDRLIQNSTDVEFIE
jgi:hypothetical protein